MDLPISDRAMLMKTHIMALVNGRPLHDMEMIREIQVYLLMSGIEYHDILAINKGNTLHVIFDVGIETYDLDISSGIMNRFI